MNPLPDKPYSLTSTKCKLNELLSQKVKYAVYNYAKITEYWGNVQKDYQHRLKNKYNHNKISAMRLTEENPCDP